MNAAESQRHKILSPCSLLACLVLVGALPTAAEGPAAGLEPAARSPRQVVVLEAGFEGVRPFTLAARRGEMVTLEHPDGLFVGLIPTAVDREAPRVSLRVVALAPGLGAPVVAGELGRIEVGAEVETLLNLGVLLDLRLRYVGNDPEAPIRGAAEGARELGAGEEGCGATALGAGDKALGDVTETGQCCITCDGVRSCACAVGASCGFCCAGCCAV